MIATFRSVVYKDFWLKLFSFVLALLIWFTVSVSIDKEGARNPLIPAEQRTFAGLPVTILSSAEDARTLVVEPKEVDVTVEGNPKILRALRPKDIRAIVDLTNIRSAERLSKRIEVSSPAGVSLVRVEPEDVKVIIPSKN
jgi:YbbR domain-containing protein